MPDEALAATRALALAMPLAPAETLRWQQAVVQALDLPRRSLAGPVPWRAALRLQRLSSIDRPRVVRAWLQALPPAPHEAAALEALRMACWILQTPAPQPDDVALSGAACSPWPAAAAPAPTPPRSWPRRSPG
jgi:hypothetical protein